jgi:hypothetical protein
LGITLNIKDLVPKWVVSISGRFTNDVLFDPYLLKVWKKSHYHSRTEKL